MKPSDKPGVDELNRVFARLQERASRELFPLMRKSALTFCILDEEPDVKVCLEIGAAVLLEKPLIVLVKRGTYLASLKLRRLADAVIEFDDPKDPDVKRQVVEAVQRIVKPTGVQ